MSASNPGSPRMANADGVLSGSPLKVPAIEIVNLLSDAEDSTGYPVAPQEHTHEEDAGSIDTGNDQWSMYEDALQGALDHDTADHSLDACTVEESLAFRKLLRTEGEDKFLEETIENGTISAKKLCTAFGIRPPAFLEGQSDEAYYNLLGLGICRELSKRVKLPQYNTIDDVVTLLKKSSNIIVLTGAGISTSLGIPDFRSKTTGLYSQLQHLGLSDPQEVFDISIFREDPTIFYSIASSIIPSTSSFSPTHAFIRLLQDKSKLLTNYTQNIDNIETHAGILPSNLIQCHGSFATASCLECKHQVPCATIYNDLKAGRVARCERCIQSLRQAQPAGGIKRKRSYGGLPTKPHKLKKKREEYEDSTDDEEADYEIAVAGVMKPDITFFGEDLPDAFGKRLTRHDRDKVDLVLVIGTSLKVAPVSEVVGFLPKETPQVYISREACAHVDFDVDLLGDCDVVVAELCRRLGWDLRHEMVPEGREVDVRLVEGYESRAAWNGARVILRQVSPESTPIFDLIIGLYLACQCNWASLASRADVPTEDLESFLDYAAVFLGNIGNYYGRGDQKFIPRMNPEALKKLSSTSPTCAKIFEEIHEPMFSSRPSSFNYPSEVAQSSYYPSDEEITRGDIERVSLILEKEGVFPENTRIQKVVEGGRGIYKVLQASTEIDQHNSCRRINIPNSSEEILVVKGDHAKQLTPVCQCLERAKEFAGNPQQKLVIDQYLNSFRTGEIEAFRESQRLWVKDLQPTVENAFGFVEPYRDPHGTRAEFEGIVAFVNTEETKVLTKLGNSSAEYICKLPWTEGFTENHGKGPFEKELFEPPDFTSLQTLAYCSSIIFPGINLPNFNDIRQDVGFQNVMISNQIAAEYKSDRTDPPFIDLSEVPSYIRPEYDAFYIWVVLHELLGHGTSKPLTQYADGSYNFDYTNPPISPLTGKPITTWYKPGQSWTGVFGDLATSLDECRAECVGAYLMDNPSLLRIFNFDETKMTPEDITYTVYLQVATAGLSALENYIEDDKRWGQAHSRAHFAMFRVLLDAGDGFLFVTQHPTTNKLTVHIDRSKVLTHGKPAIGRLLLRLHIYRCTADVVPCREYFEDLTRVDGIYSEWRSIVLANKRPRQLLVQANTFLDQAGKVILKENEPTVEGMIQSWAERGI